MDDYADYINREVDKMMKNQICNAFKTYGIEGTEEKIKELYSCNPKCRNNYLAFYHKVITRKV